MARSLRLAWAVVAMLVLAADACVAGAGESNTAGGGPPPWAGRGRRSGDRARGQAPREGARVGEGAPVVAPPRPAPTSPARPPITAPASTSPTGSSRLEVLSSAGGAKTIYMEFYGLDIDHLLRLLSYAAQVTIVKSDQVTGPITVIAPEPVPLDVAFQILDSVLAVRGFTMVKTPLGIYKVVPVAEALQSGVPLRFGDTLPEGTAGDGLITQVIPLENLSANDMANQLQGLISPNALISPTSTNSLIITDTAASIQRALDIIRDTEQQLAGGLKVFTLQYYDAAEMADLVTTIVLSRGGAGGVAARPTWERRVVGRTQAQGRPAPRAGAVAPPAASAMIGGGPEFAYPDTRTNSLIVLATPIHLRQIHDLVTQLDRPVSLRDSYFVYPVQNLVASDLATLVAPLIGAEVTTASRQSTTSQGRGSQQQGGGYGSSRQQRFGGQGGFGGAGGGASRGMSQSPGAQPRRGVDPSGLAVEPLGGEYSGPRMSEGLLIAQAPEGGLPPTPVAPQPDRPGGEQPGGYDQVTAVSTAGVAEATIAADDNTNTLLISASPERIDLLQQMLEKLDVMPPQVHIRAIIAEVALSKDSSLGFQFQSLGRTLGSFGGETFTGDIGSGFGLGKPTRTATTTGFFGTITGSEFEAVLNALVTDSRARILSAPSIFTMNNQQATIDVSQQLPFPTGTFQSTTAAGTVSTSIDYKSVGIVLDVTPRVTQGDIVQMSVQVSANEPGSEVQVANLNYPTFNQRMAQATVSVRAGETVVLGGLMRESITSSSNRVPILGDLPLVGALFRSTTSRRLKSELLVFLTPMVVRTAEEAQGLTEAEKSRLPEVPKSLRMRAPEPTPVYHPTVEQEPTEEMPPPAETIEEEAPMVAPEGQEAPVTEGVEAQPDETPAEPAVAPGETPPAAEMLEPAAPAAAPAPPAEESASPPQ